MDKSFLNRETEFTSMLESSKYMCGKNGLDPHSERLPEITDQDIERCKIWFQVTSA